MHDAHKCGHPTLARHREGSEVIVEDLIGDFEDGLVLLLHLTHELQYTADVQCAKDQINIRRPRQDFPTGALGNTATHPDQHVWPLPLEAF